MSLFRSEYFDERERWNSQVAENSARGAWAWGTAHSKGWGEILIEDPIEFGITFVQEPVVAYGFALDDEDQLVDGRFPRCNGGVVRWMRNAQDFYIGAWAFVTVSTADPLLAAQSLDVPTDFALNPNYDITHSFTFSGLAIKDFIE